MRTVEILPENYKPTKAELEESVHIDADPLAVACAVAQSVNITHKPTAKHRAELREQRKRKKKGMIYFTRKDTKEINS